MKTKSLLLSLLVLALTALPAAAAVSFPADSADLSANAYIDDYNFVAQGYGDFAGGDYVGSSTATTTYDGVACAVATEKYKIKSGGVTYTVNMTYYLARDNNDDIRVLYYQGTVKSSFQTYTIANQNLSGDAEIFIPNDPSVNDTVFWGKVTKVDGSKLVLKRSQNFNGYTFTLYFELDDQGYVDINDGSGSGFLVQSVTAEEAQYYSSTQDDDSDRPCFIGQTASPLAGLGLLLAALPLSLKRRRG